MKDDARQEQEIASAWREAVERDAHEAPPPALDAKIRAAARASGVAPPAPRRRPRYFAPLALAASVVVAVGLGLRQQRNEVPLPAPASVAPAPAATQPAAAASVARDEALPERAAPAPKEKEEKKTNEAPRAPAPAPPAADVAPPAKDVQAPVADVAPAAAKAAAQAESSAPPAYARERRDALGVESAARASGEADEPAADVVATLRALLARGERDAAVSLAREYAARRPAPALLPPDLRYLLEDTAR